MQHATTADVLLLNKFGLSEVVIKVYNVTIKKGVHVYGHLFISQKHVCFTGKTFGYNSLVKIVTIDIAQLKIKHEKELSVELENKVCSLTKNSNYLSSFRPSAVLFLKIKKNVKIVTISFSKYGNVDHSQPMEINIQDLPVF